MTFLHLFGTPLALLTAFASSSTADEIVVFDWENLIAELSPSSTFGIATADAWFDECARPFDYVHMEGDKFAVGQVSNYEIFEKPSGLCMQTLTCIFSTCYGPFVEQVGAGSVPAWLSRPMEGVPDIYVFDEDEIREAARSRSDSQLPEAVVHPAHAGDVAAAVRFAGSHGTGVSVKTSGHNWMGSSTRRGTLLLNLTKLRKYALPATLSEAVFECGSVSEAHSGAVAAACELAEARGKPAIVRFGGGQIVDEGQATVDAWNAVPGNRPYHAVTGAAGTVSLVGGWMQSGGLSGTGGHRTHGVGIDQVLHVEMVLPDGRFVRFGPSEWTPPAGDQVYPQTTTVTGFCNFGEDLSDESTWSWDPCGDDEPSFADLWLAVRGGGGGSWGVVTSVYWQLHDKTPMTAFNLLDSYDALRSSTAFPDDEKVRTLALFQEFLLTFMFDPGAIGVPASVSNGCSSPDFPFIMCYDGSELAFIDAWERHDGNNGTMTLSYTSFSAFHETGTWLLEAVEVPLSIHGGRYPDFPLGGITFSNPNSLVFPLDVLTSKLDRFLEIWTPCFLMTFYGSGEGLCFGQSGFPYLYGGAARFASDGMDAYPSHRRNGGMHIVVYNDTVREDFKRMFWEDLPTPLSSDDGSPFPGIYCHNHLYNFVSTRRSNWLEDCGQHLGDAGPGFGDCMSVQEAAFGTKTMLRLRKIHTAIDPDRLFDPPDGPGYDGDPMIRDPPPEEGDGPEAPPADEPSDSSETAGQEEEEPSGSSATVGGRFAFTAAAAVVAALFF